MNAERSQQRAQYVMKRHLTHRYKDHSVLVSIRKARFIIDVFVSILPRICPENVGSFFCFLLYRMYYKQFSINVVDGKYTIKSLYSFRNEYHLFENLSVIFIFCQMGFSRKTRDKIRFKFKSFQSFVSFFLLLLIFNFSSTLP